MSGLITEHMLLACTIIFTAALCMTGINLFLVLNTTIGQYRDKYESAVVTHTSNNLTTLVNQARVSYPEIGKAIDSNVMSLNYVKVYELEEDNVTYKPVIEIDANQAGVWFKWKSDKFGKLEYTTTNGKCYLTVREVDFSE